MNKNTITKLLVGVATLILLYGCGTTKEVIEDTPSREPKQYSGTQAEMIEIAQALKQCVGQQAIELAGGTVDSTGEGSSSAQSFSALMLVDTGNMTENGNNVYWENYDYAPTESDRPGWFQYKNYHNGAVMINSYSRHFLLDSSHQPCLEIGSKPGYPEQVDTSLIKGPNRWEFDRTDLHDNKYFREIGYYDIYYSTSNYPCTTQTISANGNSAVMYFNDSFVTSNGIDTYTEINCNNQVIFSSYINIVDSHASLIKHYDNGYEYKTKNVAFSEQVSASFTVNNKYRGDFNTAYSGTSKKVSRHSINIPAPDTIAYGPYELYENSCTGTQFNTTIYRIDDSSVLGKITFDTQNWKIYVYDNNNSLIDTINWVIFN